MAGIVEEAFETATQHDLMEVFADLIKDEASTDMRKLIILSQSSMLAIISSKRGNFLMLGNTCFKQVSMQSLFICFYNVSATLKL